MATSNKSKRKPRRHPIEIEAKKYLFNNHKFRNCFEKAFKILNIEKSTSDQKYTKTMFKDEINKKYHISSDSVESYFKTTWPPLDKIYNLAEAFNC